MAWHDLGEGVARLWRRGTGFGRPIPRIIHQTWKTAEVPERYRAFQEGWRALHPAWEYRLWTDETLRAFVAAHAPAFLPAYDGYVDPICRVDAARYLILERLGGLYVDLDVECLRPFDGLIAQGGFLIGREPASHAALSKAAKRGLTVLPCPSVIASAPGHPAWRAVRAALEKHRDKRDPLDATGPFLLSRVLGAPRVQATIRLLGPEAFYPFDKDECWSGVASDLAQRLERTRQAYAIHYWDGTWFRGNRKGVGAPAGPIGLRVLAPGEDPAASPPMTTALDPRIPGGEPPLVSCLMVTHRRAALARQAIQAFRAQTWPRRELVILDDGPDDTLARHVAGLDDASIRHVRLPHVPGTTLGELRNQAVDASRGTFVCQWDDDDLADPLRLAAQMAALAATGTDACFLDHWTFWWPRQRRAAISRRRIWEGSMLCRKAALPRYPALGRGEDTAVVAEMRRAHSIALIDAPRLYLYTCHGGNTFDDDHQERHWHAAALQASGADYLSLRAAVAARLPIAAHEAALGVEAPPPRAASAEATAPRRRCRKEAPAPTVNVRKERANVRALAAEKRGDAHEAERRWRESWSIERNAKAAVGLHRMLLRIGRAAEASAFVIQVGRDPKVSPVLRVRIEARLLERAADWPAAAALLATHEPLLQADAGLRRIYGRALLATGDKAGATALIAGAADGATAADLAVAIEGLLAGATTETAWSLLDRARKSAFRAVDASALSCLVALVSSRAGTRAAEAVIDEVSALPPTGPRVIATRIEAQYQRRRLASQRAIGGGSPPPDVSADAGNRAILDGIVPRDHAPPYLALLGTCLDLLDRLPERYPDLHPDPLNHAADALAVADRIARAIDAGQPTSLVRLGDGEGMMLPWRADLEPLRADDLDGVRRRWWGDLDLPADAWTALGRDVLDAIRDADIVGISDGVHLARALLERLAEDGSGALGSNARGRIAVLHHAARVVTPADGRPLLEPRQMLTSAHIHQALAWWDLWPAILGRAGTVDLVTCHPGLGEAVAARFGVAIGAVHLVPAERHFAARFEAGDIRHHFPDAFEAMRPRLAATPPGRVVLVAAGVLGKIYCHWVKQAGGIALDIGAAADHWLGHHTRLLSAVGDFVVGSGAGPNWRRLAASDTTIARLAGHRMLPDEGLPLLRLAGRLGAHTGFAAAFKGLVAAVRAAGLRAEVVDLPYADARRGDAPGGFASTTGPTIMLVHINPDELRHALSGRDHPGFDRQFLEAEVRIGYWAWEVAGVPPAQWIEASRQFDEIWVPGSVAAAALGPLVAVPTVVMPHAVEAIPPEGDRAALGLPEGRFLFLYVFDAESGIERKNPAGAVAAYLAAFPEESAGCALVLKAKNLDAAQRAALMAPALGRGDVLLIEGVRPLGEVRRMIAACDCYVSLHRAEGFGLTIAEAMAAGRPVICTDGTGSMDFATAETAYLVESRTVAIATAIGPYRAGTVWAEPDVDHAARLMRAVAADPAAAAETGRRAAAFVAATLSPAAIGRRVRDRVRHLCDARRGAADTVAASDGLPAVLVLTPMKNAVRHWPRYRALLERLDYPADRLSLGILEGDSEDGTYALIEEALPSLRRRFRAARLFKHDYGLHLDGPRWAPEVQPKRRSILARARNRLLSLALTDEAWVLWLDADLVDYPPDLLRRLLSTGKPVVVPHCISARTGATFDLNTFKLTADAEAIDWSKHMRDGMVQPPHGLGRTYLDAFAGQPIVPVDGVGGTALLIDAELHRDGLIFPVAPHRMYLETEGLGMLAADMGAGCWGVPDLTIVHAPD